MDVGLDNISEMVALVDDWNGKYALSPKWGDGDRLPAASTAAKLETATSTATTTRRAGDDVKFCTDCGAKILATSKFCSECGAKQEAVVEA